MIRNLLLTFFLTYPIFASAQMSGTYSIDPAGSGGNNFVSWNAAVDALESQGVNGPTTVYVKQGSYLEQVKFDSLVFSSDSQRVHFLPDTSNSSEVLLEYAGLAGTNYVIEFDSTDRVTLEGITIKNTSTNNCQRAILLDNRATNIRLIDCDISIDSFGTGSTCNSLIYSEGLNHHFEVRGCTLTKGSFGIFINASTTNRCEEISISENRFANTDDGINGFGIDGLVIEQNHIYKDDPSANSSGSVGINLQYVDDFIINSNLINGGNEVYFSSGIRLLFCVGNSNPRSQVVNNCVLSTGGGTHALRLYASGNVDVFHNTAIALGASNAAASFEQGGLIRIKNNVFKHSGPSGIALLVNNPYTISEADYNSYNSNGDLINWLGNIYNTVQAFESGTGFGENSMDTEVSFQDTLLCRSCSESIENSGSPFVSVSDDIEGNSRSTSHPDIGAVEFISQAFSLGPDSTYCQDEMELVGGPASSASWLINGNTYTTENVYISAINFPTTYSVSTTIETEFCGTVSDAAVITLIPEIGLDSHLHLCAREIESLTAQGGSAFIYQWSSGQNTSTINIDEADVYSVIRTGLGCSDTSEIIVSQSDSIHLDTYIEECEDDAPITLDATIYNGVAYTWDGGSSLNTATNTFDDEGWYSVTATDNLGCSDSLDFRLRLLDEPEAIINWQASGTIIMFDGTNSNDKGIDPTYSWSFWGGAGAASPSSSSDSLVQVIYPWGDPWTFFATLEINNGCGIDIEQWYWDVIPGIDENEQFISIGPNPVIDKVNIDYPSFLEGKYEIHDGSGRIIQNGKLNSVLDLNVHSGTYWLQLNFKEMGDSRILPIVVQ